MTEPNDRLRTGIALTAHQLLETWEHLGASHKMLGGSCSCGAHGVVIRLADFEQDIGEYLRTQGEQHQRRDVLELLDRSARDGDLWSVAGFLERLAEPAASADPAAAAFILDRLSSTVQSFEQLHRRR